MKKSRFKEMAYDTAQYIGMNDKTDGAVVMAMMLTGGDYFFDLVDRTSVQIRRNLEKKYTKRETNDFMKMVVNIADERSGYYDDEDY